MLKKIPEIIAQARLTLNTLTANEAVQQCNANNGVMVDVREPAEFAQRSATGTINIPRGLLEMKMLDLYPDAEKAIYIHCATGARATFSAEQLKRVGYNNVWVITSSLNDICSAC